jgi:hypothetical protein
MVMALRVPQEVGDVLTSSVSQEVFHPVELVVFEFFLTLNDSEFDKYLHLEVLCFDAVNIRQIVHFR